MNTLYRFYAADGSLLYIGITRDPARRFAKHSHEKPWWETVARIDMEQHPTRGALQVAERLAINAEKPLHNIQMNGSRTGAKTSEISDPTSPADETDGLTGRWFHSWREAQADDSDHVTLRNGLVLEWQGQVIDRVENGLYLIQLYSWWDGTPSNQQLVEAREMTRWTFFYSHIEMIVSLGCTEEERGRKCGGDVSYLTVGFLGTNGVCGSCAGYYGQVRPVIWDESGRAALGKTITVPHPLSVEGISRR